MSFHCQHVAFLALEDNYKMKYPVDLQLLWNFCLSISDTQPKYALKGTLGLTLAGPFDVLMGNVILEPHLHCR